MASLVIATLSNITTDQYALLALKAQISYDPYNVLSKNWSTGSSICNWAGITCGSSLRRVIALNLSHMDLVGTIPPHIGNLSFLVSLNIENNSFHGSLPNELSYLYNLQRIDLRDNLLSGPMPSNVSNMLSLQVINLRGNDFSGSLPLEIGNLIMLKELNLGKNIFGGTIPHTLFKCKQLQILSLSQNKFTGSVPLGIGNLTKLKQLGLAHNNFGGEIPSEIGNLQNIEIFEIGFNHFNGIIPFEIFNISTIQKLSVLSNNFSGHLPSNVGLFLPNLQILYLWGNQLSGSIPSSLSNASQLNRLDLHDNSFSGLIPKALGNLRLLQGLSVGDNNLTIESSTPEFNFFSSLSNLTYLTGLDLSGNLLNAIIPSSIRSLPTSLQQLFIDECNIMGSIPSDIGNLSNLITLSLRFNDLAGPIPTDVGRLHKLQSLRLDNNRLQGPIPTDLCQIKGLYELLFGDNELSGTIPTCVSNMTSLRYLYLNFNELTSTIPLSLWKLTDILTIDLSTNSLIGSLSLEMGNLKVLTVLDLSKNQLSGNIPTTISDLKHIANLSLANNRLEGAIPKSFSELVSVEFLDLSNNNLSGEIPKSLEALSYLKYLNVSFNRLQGKIPSGGPFAHFSAASFMSNDGLCGAPQLQVPPCKEGVSRPKNTVASSMLKYVLPAIGLTLIVVALVIVWTSRRKKNAKLPMEANPLPLATWRRISQQELIQATKGFNTSNLLGKGSFGSVYKGTLSNGMIVAIKVFNLVVEGASKSFDTECGVLRNIRHRNLIKIINACSSIDFKAFVLEYMPHGNLEKWLYSPDRCLSILQRLNIMIDVASALEYLHYGYSTPIVHCDLKPSNILLDEDMVAHVADFGIVKLLGDGDSMMQTMTLATIGYMAPEYASGGIVSTRGDVYSYGILLMETFTRKKPTDDMFDGEMSLKRWVKESSPLSVTKVVDARLLRIKSDCASMENCTSSLMRLALQCCVELPELRINAKGILITLNKIKLKFLQDTDGS